MTVTRILSVLLPGLLLGASMTQAQSEQVPLLDFGIHAMQSAQFVQTESGGPNQNTSDEAEFGFHRVRFNLTVSAAPNDRVSAFVDVGHESNDFGADFAPAVDYAALDLHLTDALTVRGGTPVTGLFNFRGYSDGAVTQSNPLIGNSIADFVTAETGVALLGSHDSLN